MRLRPGAQHPRQRAGGVVRFKLHISRRRASKRQMQASCHPLRESDCRVAASLLARAQAAANEAVRGRLSSCPSEIVYRGRGRSDRRAFIGEYVKAGGGRRQIS